MVNKIIKEAASFCSDAKLVLKHMAICWEVPPSGMISRKDLIFTKNIKNPQIPYAVPLNFSEEDMVHRKKEAISEIPCQVKGLVFA